EAELRPEAVRELRAREVSALVARLRDEIPVRFDEEALAPLLGNTASSGR
ncbi:MAG: hypothetical protein H5U40_12085, partial [Polyangiaceae bacterium]|nr:hypothetical protein [Polyangiaceae bacterium]